ncbi:histidinol-phosphate transaminase [Flexistipes sp.]|uniref:histidinol-phosphate transaminase n=1 Tax=Flexistipes sp. TaxID=3088135 RepID=UPI002E1D8067|nr:histidinol-phosphate transaminase [Flexistipes sp.]
MTDFEKLAGENISSLIPYKPGKPLKELERELGISEAIKLASNENMMGVPEKAKQAVKEHLDEMNFYPLGDAFYLKKKLARMLSVSPERLIFGTGSNEIIELLIRTFTKEGESILSYFPSFSVYGIIAKAAGIECKWVPVKDDFYVDFDKIKEAMDESVRIVFLANPNNPTGTYISAEQLEDFIEYVDENTLIALDEAYVEYVDAPDFPNTFKLLEKYPNLISMRTFSKAYGLAGFRIGYAIGHEKCIDMLNRVRQPFNVNMVAQIAAEAALDDKDFLRSSIKNNREGKRYLYKEFERLGLKYIETQSNFILVNVGDGEEVFNKLLTEGVIVRFLGQALKEYVRVTIGTPEQNKIFIDKLSKVLEG